MQTCEQALENTPIELKPCPCCAKNAILRAKKWFTYPNKYLGVVYEVGCFECGMYLTGIKEYSLCDNGKFEVVEDEYAQIVQKWNDRKQYETVKE